MDPLNKKKSEECGFLKYILYILRRNHIPHVFVQHYLWAFVGSRTIENQVNWFNLERR